VSVFRHEIIPTLQELVKCSQSYIASFGDASRDQPLRMLLDACRLPCVMHACGDDAAGAAVLLSAVQVSRGCCTLKCLEFVVDSLAFRLLQLCFICHSHITGSGGNEGIQAAVIAHSIVDG
jgi:hypothetical protein